MDGYCLLTHVELTLEVNQIFNAASTLLVLAIAHFHNLQQQMTH